MRALRTSCRALPERATGLGPRIRSASHVQIADSGLRPAMLKPARQGGRRHTDLRLPSLSETRAKPPRSRTDGSEANGDLNPDSDRAALWRSAASRQKRERQADGPGYRVGRKALAPAQPCPTAHPVQRRIARACPTARALGPRDKPAVFGGGAGTALAAPLAPATARVSRLLGEVNASRVRLLSAPVPRADGRHRCAAALLSTRTRLPLQMRPIRVQF